MHRSSLRILALSLVMVAGAVGCTSSTKLVSQWENPQGVPARFARLLVIGVTRQPALRRTFEDQFVARLKAVGVDAVPSYLSIPQDGQVEEARLQEAVRQTGADAILMTRLVSVERKTEVTPGSYGPVGGFGPVGGMYPWYSAGWVGYYDPPRVYQYDVYLSETSLYDVPNNRLVWSGTVETRAPGDLDRAITRYVDTVIKALKKEQVLA